eukprot:524063-Hanusia_phi.AAC.2
MLEQLCRSLSQQDVAASFPRIFKFFLDSLDLRFLALAGKASVGGEEAVEVEGAMLAALEALVLKLNESRFKPSFLKLYDWATVLEDKQGATRSDKEAELHSLQRMSRLVTLSRVVNRLGERLKGIMVPYFSYLLQLFLSILSDRSTLFKSLPTSAQTPSSTKKRKRDKEGDQDVAKQVPPSPPPLYHPPMCLSPTMNPTHPLLGILCLSRLFHLLPPLSPLPSCSSSSDFLEAGRRVHRLGGPGPSQVLPLRHHRLHQQGALRSPARPPRRPPRRPLLRQRALPDPCRPLPQASCRPARGGRAGSDRQRPALEAPQPPAPPPLPQRVSHGSFRLAPGRHGGGAAARGGVPLPCAGDAALYRRGARGHGRARRDLRTTAGGAAGDAPGREPQRVLACLTCILMFHTSTPLPLSRLL